jgi:hypothetical protein
MAFDYAVRQLKREDVPEFLKKRQAVFIERADRGETEQTLFDVLALIHTPEARAALERAAKSCPLESARGHARRTLEAWKDE